MSVCLPFTNDCVARSGKRWMFNIVGGLLFVVLYTVLPGLCMPISESSAESVSDIRQDIPGRQCSIHLERFPLRPVCLNAICSSTPNWCQPVWFCFIRSCATNYSIKHTLIFIAPI